MEHRFDEKTSRSQTHGVFVMRYDYGVCLVKLQG